MQTAQNQITIEPKKMGYQRNGVSGIPFYTLTFDWKDLEGDSGKDFVITFETDETDEEIKLESCRVIDVSNPFSTWRGDMFGQAVQSKLKEIGLERMVGLYYDIQELMKN